MAYAVERIPPGHPIKTSLEALYARRKLSPGAAVTLRGALDRATLVAAPDTSPIALGGPLYLVQATAVPAGDRVEILGTVSWSDHGLPRMAGGLIDDAISAGVQVLVPTAAGPEVEAPSPIADAPVHREPKTRPERPRARRPRPEDDSPHVDLSAEMAMLTPDPASTPAPARSEPAPAAPPAGGGGGWAAAVAASTTRPARSAARAADPSDLGFDVDGDPDLKSGDLLIHPRFGRCKVIKVADDKIKVRRPTGAFIDLHMKVCTFSRLPDEDGRRAFEVRIGKKKRR